MCVGRTISCNQPDLVQQTSGGHGLDAERHRFLRRLPRCVVAAEGALGKGEVREWKRVSGTAPEGIPCLRLGPVVAPDPVVDERQRIRRARIAGVCGLPHLQGFRRTLLISSHTVVVLIRDEQPLTLAHPVQDAVGQARVLLAPPPLAQTAVDGGQCRVGGGELRVDRERLIEECHRLELASLAPLLEAERVGLERRQRRSGRLLDRHAKPLDRRQRFTKRRANLARDRAKLRQHPFLAGRLALRAGQGFSGLALGGVQRQDVVAAERSD